MKNLTLLLAACVHAVFVAAYLHATEPPGKPTATATVAELQSKIQWQSQVIAAMQVKLEGLSKYCQANDALTGLQASNPDAAAAPKPSEHSKPVAPAPKP